jgi:hypothetical protein
MIDTNAFRPATPDELQQVQGGFSLGGFISGVVNGVKNAVSAAATAVAKGLANAAAAQLHRLFPWL